MQADQISNTVQSSNNFILCQTAANLQEVGEAIAVRLSRKLAREDMGREELLPILKNIINNDPCIIKSAAADIVAICNRDAACSNYLEPLLFFKGFAAIQTYRISNSLWNSGRKTLALYFQSISAEVFGVDIHPAARIGCGILMDHGTSVVIGETAIVEDNVSILHEVTLGGTGKSTGDRHPIIRTGVMIGSGTKIIGRVEIGAHSKIGAGSVVLNDIPEKKTAVGVPAKIVGEINECPAELMNQNI